MKKIALLLSCALAIALACSFIADESSVKQLTKPYVTTYECTQATLGGRDLLDGYAYIRCELCADGELKIITCKKDGTKRTVSGTYAFDDQTRELTADIAFLGANANNRVKLENGKFMLSTHITGLPLIIIFEAM